MLNLITCRVFFSKGRGRSLDEARHPSNDSGIQMGSMLFPSQESINSRPSDIIDGNYHKERADSEMEVFFKEKETEV